VSSDCGRCKLSAILNVAGLTKHFQGVAAVDGIDMSVEANEILAIIGPNGSGKTTLFNLVSGFLKPTSGEIVFDGERINGQQPHRLVRRGLVRTFQQAMSFPDLTVFENVGIAIHAVGRLASSDVDPIMQKCGLTDVAYLRASTLPYGKQRKLGVAIALATRPRLLLLDEPAAGLGDDAAVELSALIRNIRTDGVSVVLIDHDMPFVLPVADRVIVMEAGRKLFEGLPKDAVANRQVVEVYLGHDFA